MACTYLRHTVSQTQYLLLQGRENSSFGQMFHMLILKLIDLELSGKHESLSTLWTLYVVLSMLILLENM